MSGSAEADRIIKVIRKNDTPNISALVQVADYPEFLQCVMRISTECPSTYVLIAAFIDKANSEDAPKTTEAPAKLKLVMFATIVPPSRSTFHSEWYESTRTQSTLLHDPERSNVLSSPDGSGYTVAVWEVLGFQQTPEKLADQAIGVGTHYLRRSGMLPEEEEEKEYNFDDI